MKRSAVRLIFCANLALLLLLQQSTAQTPASPGLDGESDAYFRNHSDASKYFFIIVGASASEDIGNRFRQWAFSLTDILHRDYAYSNDNIVLLFGEGRSAISGDAAAVARVDGSSRREDIERHMRQLQTSVKAGDQVTFFLIGHGSNTGAGNEAKFNIVGPDITGTEFADLLRAFNQQDVVVVNTTSASFEFSRALSLPGRVNISATRSRAERFDPMFAEFFIGALNQRSGDRDKNGRVSLLEAFTVARLQVENWYREQGRLATEHAVLDDNGDGLFSMEPAANQADGRLAEIAYVDITRADTENLSAAALQLRAEMQDLERSVFILRGQKANYLEDDYWNRMEVLLLDLARKTERFNELR